MVLCSGMKCCDLHLPRKSILHFIAMQLRGYVFFVVISGGNRGTNFAVEMASEKRKRLSDPAYRRHRLAFLRNMQVYTRYATAVPQDAGMLVLMHECRVGLLVCSDEARVRSTAK